MKFKQLDMKDYAFIRGMYASKLLSKKEVQEAVAKHYGIHPRTVRKWANKLGINTMNAAEDQKILVYDIETSRVEVKAWGTGKTYINHGQLRSETRIISIAYKWLGQDEVNWVKWDMKTHDDRQLMVDFLKIYNEADMLIGQNNDRFDNKLVRTRAAKHGLFVNVLLPSFDLYKEAKRVFRLQSYSMAYMAKFFGVTLKQSHEGIYMWDMIEDGTPAQQKEYIKKMIDYNVGDIVTTEELYVVLRKYLGHKVHFGVANGKQKYTCPNCGSEHVSLFQTSYTAAGTPKRNMVCGDCDVQYKISNRDYFHYLNR